MPVRTAVDYRVYQVTTGTDRRTVSTAAAAAAGGAGVIQVRAKGLTARPLLALVTEVAAAVAAAHPSTRVVVDDSVEVAYAARLAGAPVHGVHLGADDLPPAAARALLGPDALIGWTTGTLDLVRTADTMRDSIDYVGAGPFRPTPTKQVTRPPLGLTGYLALVAATELPIVAIGDVTPADVADLAGTGVAGVAMVRAIADAADPEALVRDCVAAFDRGAAEARCVRR
ncbi:thiamine phosphate synthase [Granulicoccus phenolivorans]|uniref:thiamine phosphate synthase n=1 Tax=Granulicoccus phenolivorans TaxID=266854 RepID=UPI00040424A1|nr:thiamine phosphate synthase [Granulicoccus phenolivorans]